MQPKPIPKKLIEQGVGLPMRFTPPEGEEHIGTLEVLNLTHPEQIRALLTGTEPDHPAGSKDFWISWWEPDEEERRKIAAGAPVRLTIHGATSINPMSLDVGNNLDDHYYNQQSQN
jgi:hypothetical protein